MSKKFLLPDLGEGLPDATIVEWYVKEGDVIRLDELNRLQLCGADDCNAVFVDLSRNRSKRYCDVGNCGNRMNVIAYRRRKAEESA